MTADASSNWRLAKAERFLSAADRALEADDGETAVSRAYYAAYHAVIALLETRAGINRRRWDHSQLQGAFRREFGAKGFLFSIRDSSDFDKLYEERLIADYERLVGRHAAATKALTVAHGLTGRIRRIVDDR